MAQTRHILIVDDEAEVRGALAEQLALHEEFSVSVAEDATSARRRRATPTRPISSSWTSACPTWTGARRCA